ncbi:AprI/Inh family metalloprotease inhibitor [Pseudochelatococcus lubricantis]|uniref:AprI/Inh family metalloprotease inhibitor n=1 Tax=Pseudochelatococcus lubricantis TaxID=1538102 RepID=UPI0035EAADD9
MNSGMIRVAEGTIGVVAARLQASTPRAANRRWRRAMRFAPALGGALLLGACADSARFSTSGPYGGPVGGGPRVIAAPVDDIEPAPRRAPAAPVVSTPLPPPPGSQAAPEPTLTPMPSATTPPPGADLSQGADPNAALDNNPPPGPVASLPASPPPAAPPPAVAPSRTSVTGSWRASEAAGSSCRVTLSSAPSLDLYRASSSGCASQDLKSVNAWDLRGNEVYLYARGNVVARLRGGGGNFNGVLAKSGAPVSLSR